MQKFQNKEATHRKVNKVAISKAPVCLDVIGMFV